MADTSWLRSGTGFPSGGRALKVQYREGNQTSRLHLAIIGPFVATVLGCDDVFAGSLNLYAASPLELPNPARIRCSGEDWLFVPAIIAERAVGVAARRPPPDASDFLEIFACNQIAPVLGIAYGDELTVRLLPGSYLELAA